jgi:hypothetical protein
MAEPTEFERLRQATKVKEGAWDYLAETEEMQRQRWDVLRQVVDDAAWQYTSMRIDSVAESLRDQGAPLWLSCILAVGVSLIPVSALTGTFLFALTKSTQKLLTRSDRALLESVKNIALREQNVPRALNALSLWRHLPGEIKRTEELVSKFAAAWEPELADLIRDGVLAVEKFLGDQPFKRESARKFDPIDAPVVVVKRSLRTWIDAQVRAEGVARKMIKDRIRDLFDIASSSKPAKEASDKEAEFRKKEEAREPRVPFRRPFEKLPKTREEALGELTKLRDDLAPLPAENRANTNPKDLLDLQLTIESMIWVTTYDFTPKFDQFVRDDPDGVTIKGPPTLIEAPLPEGLWNRLIGRYIDPDEGRSYKDVGYVDRLGTNAYPYIIIPKHPSSMRNPGEGGWGPKVRLSHYFSQILYPKIDHENSEIVRKFSAQKVR